MVCYWAHSELSLKGMSSLCVCVSVGGCVGGCGAGGGGRGEGREGGVQCTCKYFPVQPVFLMHIKKETRTGFGVILIQSVYLRSHFLPNEGTNAYLLILGNKQIFCSFSKVKLCWIQNVIHVLIFTSFFT